MRGVRRKGCGWWGGGTPSSPLGSDISDMSSGCGASWFPPKPKQPPGEQKVNTNTGGAAKG